MAILLALTAGFAGPAAAITEEAPQGSLLDSYNQAIFRFNKSFFSLFEKEGGPVQIAANVAPEPPSAVSEGLRHMAHNFVQEPMAFVAASVAGEWTAASQTAARFFINTTVGLLGFYDRAGEWGIRAYGNDLGLVLCARGVGDGPYVMLPFIGPRTLRDGMVDVVVANAILVAMIYPFLPSSSALETLAALQVAELGAEVATAREMDPDAKAMNFDSYHGMREAYLKNRRNRCESLRQTARAG